MALKSGGTIPTEQSIVDSNQAMAILATMHHWSAKAVNGVNGRIGVEVNITHAGRRVCAQRQTFPVAVIAAMNKLRQPRVKNKSKDAPVLRLAD